MDETQSAQGQFLLCWIGNLFGDQKHPSGWISSGIFLLQLHLFIASSALSQAPTWWPKAELLQFLCSVGCHYISKSKQAHFCNVTICIYMWINLTILWDLPGSLWLVIKHYQVISGELQLLTEGKIMPQSHLRCLERNKETEQFQNFHFNSDRIIPPNSNLKQFHNTVQSEYNFQ
jgi:hypothetical protein